MERGRPTQRAMSHVFIHRKRQSCAPWENAANDCCNGRVTHILINRRLTCRPDEFRSPGRGNPNRNTGMGLHAFLCANQNVHLSTHFPSTGCRTHPSCLICREKPPAIRKAHSTVAVRRPTPRELSSHLSVKLHRGFKAPFYSQIYPRRRTLDRQCHLRSLSGCPLIRQLSCSHSWRHAIIHMGEAT